MIKLVLSLLITTEFVYLWILIAIIGQRLYPLIVNIMQVFVFKREIFQDCRILEGQRSQVVLCSLGFQSELNRPWMQHIAVSRVENWRKVSLSEVFALTRSRDMNDSDVEVLQIGVDKFLHPMRIPWQQVLNSERVCCRLELQILADNFILEHDSVNLYGVFVTQVAKTGNGFKSTCWRRYLEISYQEAHSADKEVRFVGVFIFDHARDWSYLQTLTLTRTSLRLNHISLPHTSLSQRMVIYRLRHSCCILHRVYNLDAGITHFFSLLSTVE